MAEMSEAQTYSRDFDRATPVRRRCKIRLTICNSLYFLLDPAAFDLGENVARNFYHRDDPRDRNFNAGAEGDDLFGDERPARHDREPHFLKAARSRHADRRDIGNRGMMAHDVFDQLRRQLCAADIDDVGHATRDDQHAVRPDPAPIAGVEPAVADTVAIAWRRIRAPHAVGADAISP